MKKIIFFLTTVVFFCSCANLGVFEKQVPFANHEWSSKEVPSFNFEIKDTGIAYNLFVVIRHEDAYHFKNIWLNITIKDPDSSYTIKREFPFSDNTRWLGSGIDDVIEHRINFNTLPVNLKKGNYTFTLQQIMREDPLQHVLNAGIRVEKVKS